MYNIFYDFFADYIFTDAQIRDRDIILHYSSVVSCILVLVAVIALIRALLRLLDDNDGNNKRRRWL
jgi:hypothetical protein